LEIAGLERDAKNDAELEMDSFEVNLEFWHWLNFYLHNKIFIVLLFLTSYRNINYCDVGFKLVSYVKIWNLIRIIFHLFFGT
jgi:hypothetical protein